MIVTAVVAIVLALIERPIEQAIRKALARTSWPRAQIFHLDTISAFKNQPVGASGL